MDGRYQLLGCSLKTGRDPVRAIRAKTGLGNTKKTALTSLFLHVDGGYAKSRVLVRVFLRKGAWGLGWTKNAGSKAGARAMRQEMGRKKKVKTGYLGLYEGAATA